MNYDIEALITAGKFLYEQGWSPATSSNYSHRLPNERAVITVSGKHKGKLTASDFLVVNLDGAPLPDAEGSIHKPSAETALHTQLYRQFPWVNCVLHTHSVNATVLSQLLYGEDMLYLNGYELQKAFRGVSTHVETTAIPIVENSQDIEVIESAVQSALEEFPDCPAYLIRGHGLYAWGEDVESTLKYLEALEFLFQCEYKLKDLRP